MGVINKQTKKITWTTEENTIKNWNESLQWRKLNLEAKQNNNKTMQQED